MTQVNPLGTNPFFVTSSSLPLSSDNQEDIKVNVLLVLTYQVSDRSVEAFLSTYKCPQATTF